MAMGFNCAHVLACTSGPALSRASSAVQREQATRASSDRQATVRQCDTGKNPDQKWRNPCIPAQWPLVQSSSGELPNAA
jgi:hypothetical protein